MFSAPRFSLDNPESIAFQIRPPWPDERLRLREFMRLVFEGTDRVTFLIAVQGPLERIVAATAIIPPETAARAAILRWRAPGRRYNIEEVLRALFKRTAELYRQRPSGNRLRLADFVREESPEAAALIEAGFAVEASQDVFEMPAAEVWARVDRLYQRLTSRGVIPSNSRFAPLTPDRIPEAAALLRRYLPEGEAALAFEHEGFAARNSYVLLVDEAVKGLLLCRLHGEIAHIGAVLVTEELRSGYHWANLSLHYWSLREAIDYGVTRLRLTADPRLHPNTIDFTRLWKTKHVGRRLLFAFRLPSAAECE